MRCVVNTKIESTTTSKAFVLGRHTGLESCPVKSCQGLVSFAWGLDSGSRSSSSGMTTFSLAKLYFHASRVPAAGLGMENSPRLKGKGEG